MEDRTKIVIIAIGVITLLEIVALFKGVDGTVFALVISAIAGLAGYEIKTIKDNLIK